MSKNTTPMPAAVSATAEVKELTGVKSGFSTAKIAYIAMFVAINVAISAMSPRLGTLKLTLTYTICYLAGHFFGASAGGLTGGLGDVLGCLIAGTVPNPIIFAANCLVGIIPGLVRFLGRGRTGRVWPYAQILASYLITYVVCTLFINTYALYVLGLGKGATFWAYMGIRAASQTPIVAINLAVTMLIYPLFKRLYARLVRK